MKVIAIDLGTTNSVVAIPEERQGDFFLTRPGCPGCSVIRDEHKRGFTPSVLAEDADGKPVVGYKAKARAGMRPEPIMFAKRVMGTSETFERGRLGKLRPEDVSAHILRHLKAMAEKQLGEPVEEAVITVPAYFSLRAKQLTKAAGEMAGLKVAQIAQEPVAAALMYCANQSRDPLRIMTYDLGGGTFDVAIVEKRGGVIASDSILSHDGDMHLGGYNFDKALALWIVDRLNTEGNYDLDLDPDNPDDSVIFAKLMVIAEQAKIALSKAEVHQIQEPATGIVDHAGTPVSIDLEVSREQFQALIEDEVEKTIEICRDAIDKANQETADTSSDGQQTAGGDPTTAAAAGIHEIIMVGGSSRIPLVAQRLEQEFGRRPLLVDPDLCVALGAAMICGRLGQDVGQNMRLSPISAETDLPALTVTGNVTLGGDLDSVAGCTVTLRTADGSMTRSRTTGDDGAFVFGNVRLARDDTTEFILSAAGPDGREVASHRFSVLQTATPSLTDQQVGLGDVPQLLSKPIRVMLASGPHEVAAARTALPFQTVIPTKTTDTSGLIELPILEENNVLGTILIEDVPRTLAVGSTVQVTLTINRDFLIEGRAYVPAAGLNGTVAVNLTPPQVRSVDELRRDYEELSAKAEEALAAAGPGALLKGGTAKRLKDRMKHCEEMLGEPRAPDRPRIQDCLDEIGTLVDTLGRGWRPEPPKPLFDQKARETEDTIERLVTEKPETRDDGYDQRLQAIRDEADKAYQLQNGPVWRDCYTRVVKLCDSVHEQLQTTEGGPPPPPPEQLLLLCSNNLAALRTEADRRERLEEFWDRFDDAAQALEQITPSEQNAMTRIYDWHRTKYLPLYEDLERPPAVPGRLELDQ